MDPYAVCDVEEMMRVIFGIRTIYFACMAACVLLAACSQGDANTSGHARTTQHANAHKAGRTLTYYLDQTVVVAGLRAVQHGQYEAFLNGCKEAGEKIIALPAPDVAKLSAGREQTWQAPGKVAKQTDIWKLEGGVGTIGNPVCHFKLKKESKLIIRYESGKIYNIDLTTGTDSVDRVAPMKFAKPPISSGEVAAREQSGKRDGTIKGPVRNVVGQPCQVWTHPEAQTAEPWEECVWSGGERWGFPPDGGIVLTSRMLDGEQTLTTTTFLVGRLPDGDKIFEVPKNVSIRDEGAPAVGGKGS